MKKCPFCAEDIQDAALVCRYCQRVLTAGVATAPPKAQTWNPGVAAVLSFFIPGLGQLYKGQIALGLILLVATLAGYLMLILPGVVIHIVVIVHAYSSRTEPLASVPSRGARPELTPEQIADLKRRNWNSLWVVAAVLVVMVGLAGLVGALRPVPGQSVGPAGPESDSAAWAERLRGIVTSAGEQCANVVTTFHQGRDSKSGANFWNVRCTDGGAYSIQLTPNAAPRVLACHTLTAVAGVRCFVTF